MNAPGRALLCLAVLAASTACAQTNRKLATVKVTGGTVVGTVEGAAAVFRGVPYAAPPTGDLRWRPPQPVAPWPGKRLTSDFSNACFQDPGGLNGFLAPLAAAYGAPYETKPQPSSEDCLYLDVWAPLPQQKAGLPVMVWLHGGSNLLGSGGDTAYDGGPLAKHGVVVVTINYRLGIFGFFSHPELTAESPHHSSGNYALLDQLAALQWVKDNIHAFGGDPANVTVFGESAGSIDAATLITSPLAAGLFRRVILESGPAFGLGTARTLAQGEAFGAGLGKLAPSPTAASNANRSAPPPAEDKDIERLRSLPPDALVRLVKQAAKTGHSADVSSAVIDGWVLPQSPAAAFATGAIQPVDMMVGINAREMSAFRIGPVKGPLAPVSAAPPAPATKPPAAVEQPAPAAKAPPPPSILAQITLAVRPLYGSYTNAALGRYMAEGLFDADAAIDKAANDMLMACPTGAEAALTTAAGNHAYVYEFARSIPGKGEHRLGAFHSLEVPYVFHAFEDRSWRWLHFSEVDETLSTTMQTYWTNFARTGDPNTNGLPSWPPWQDKAEPFMRFTNSGEAEAQKGFSPPFCHLAVDRLKQQLVAR